MLPQGMAVSDFCKDSDIWIQSPISVVCMGAGSSGGTAPQALLGSQYKHPDDKFQLPSPNVRGLLHTGVETVIPCYVSNSELDWGSWGLHSHTTTPCSAILLTTFLLIMSAQKHRPDDNLTSATILQLCNSTSSNSWTRIWAFTELFFKAQIKSYMGRGMPELALGRAFTGSSTCSWCVISPLNWCEEGLSLFQFEKESLQNPWTALINRTASCGNSQINWGHAMKNPCMEIAHGY